jgi:PAS domain S-box-containing protein
MSLRDDVVDLLLLDDDQQFERRAADRFDGVDAARDSLEDGERSVDDVDALPPLDDHERALVDRIRTLDDVPLGLTLSGPAYQDNPIRYANRTFREMTGYSLAQLVGENPRLLQGPETEAAAVDDLREAIDIWERVTVELQNYRRDGTPFRNRVSLVPVEDDTGTITNWLGVQDVVD